MRFPRRLRALSFLLAFALIGLTPVTAAAQTKSEVDRAAAARDAAYNRLVVANDQLDDAIREYAIVSGELEDVTWRISQLYERIQDDEAEVRALKSRAKDLVLEAYMTGGAGGDLMSIAFSAGSIQEILTTQILLSRAASYDLVSLDRLDAVRREMSRLKDQLEIDQRRVAELRGRSEAVVDRLDELQAETASAYREADSEADSVRAKFEAEQRRKRLAALAAKAGAAGGVSQGATPGFQCPAPTARFINDWGFPRSGGRTHKGTDMMAPRGDPAVAVASGTVRFKTNRLGGIVAYLSADHGVLYYYAHLNGYADGLTSGQRVAGGAVIGYIGDSGNAKGGATHLHFEIRPGGSSAANPYPTLARSC